MVFLLQKRNIIFHIKRGLKRELKTRPYLFEPKTMVIYDRRITVKYKDYARDIAVSHLVENNKKYYLFTEDYQVIAYEDLARDPDSYTGQDIKITGRVLQVLEGDTETTLRVATSGNYDDVVMVGFDPTILNGTRVLEEDNVTVCGTYIGIYKYQSAIGTTISVPGLYGELVTIN